MRRGRSPVNTGRSTAGEPLRTAPAGIRLQRNCSAPHRVNTEAAHKAKLDAKLALAEACIKDAQAHEREHGLTRHRTRKHASDALLVLRHWRAAHGSTMHSEGP